MATFEQTALFDHIRYLREQAVAARVAALEDKVAMLLQRIDTMEQRRRPGRPRKAVNG